jgi:hypothetical protein
MLSFGKERGPKKKKVFHPLLSSSHEVLTSKKRAPGHFNLKKSCCAVLLKRRSFAQTSTTFFVF